MLISLITATKNYSKPITAILLRNNYIETIRIRCDTLGSALIRPDTSSPGSMHLASSKYHSIIAEAAREFSRIIRYGGRNRAEVH